MAEVRDVAVIGTGVIGLAVAAELLQRGLSVAVVGPRTGAHRGQATRAAGAMLSTFSEIEPQHTAERARVETAERLAAHELYPGWLARLNDAAGTGLRAVPGTWVLAPTGRHGHLSPIAAAAHRAGHAAEEHPPDEIPGLNAPSSSAGALWLPTEARIDSAALMESLTRVLEGHSLARWHDATADSIAAGGSADGSVRCHDGTDVHAREVVLAAGTAIPDLLPERGAPLGVPPILAGRGASVLLNAPALVLPHVVRTPNSAFACGAHLVPRADGTLYLGGTNRLTTSPDPDRAAALDEIAVLAGDAATLLDPALGAVDLLAARVGLRPYTVDHLPVLGRTQEPTLLVAGATYRCGVLLAPRIAALIADEITCPGALDGHPYRILRPMPAPSLDQILDEGAAAALLEHLLQGGGHLPPSAAAGFTAFAALALRALTDEQSREGAALRRLWRAAPVAEAVPSLYALARRLEDSR